MQVNFNKVLLDDGRNAIIEPIRKFVMENEKTVERDITMVFTLQRACVKALLSETQESQKESIESKMERSRLADRIYDADGDIEVSAEEIALIKKKMNEIYGALVVGQAYRMLEGQA